MTEIMIQEILMLIGNKEIIIFNKDKEIELLRNQIKELKIKLKQQENENG